MEVAILLNRNLCGCYFASLGIFSLLSMKARSASRAKLLCYENFPMLGKFALDAPLTHPVLEVGLSLRVVLPFRPDLSRLSNILGLSAISDFWHILHD